MTICDIFKLIIFYFYFNHVFNVRDYVIDTLREFLAFASYTNR